MNISLEDSELSSCRRSRVGRRRLRDGIKDEYFSDEGLGMTLIEEPCHREDTHSVRRTTLMAWSGKVINNFGDVILTETIAGPNSNTTTGLAHSSDFNPYVKGIDPAGHRYVSLYVRKVTGTIAAADLSIDMWGSNSGATGSADVAATTQQRLLADPGSIGDLNTTTTTAAHSTAFDLAAYPAAYRFITLEGDSSDDDSDCTFEIAMFIPKV